MKYDTIILGAGASGLFCAGTARARGKRVLVIDHAKQPCLKVGLSGGGKCNYSNRNVAAEHYCGQNPHFPISALERLSCEALTHCLTMAAIAVEEREHGQMFCRHSASDMVRFLLDGLGGTEPLFLSTTVHGVERGSDGFSLTIEKGGSRRIVQGKTLVIATGNTACPQAGATDFGLRLAKQFGHRLVQSSPALVGLVLPADWPLSGLSGISIPASIHLLGQGKNRPQKAATPAENLPLLFTHRGISGPAALQTSLYWEKGEALRLDFLPGLSLARLLGEQENAKLLLKSLMKRLFPDRLALALLDLAESALVRPDSPKKATSSLPLAETRVAGLSAAIRNSLGLTLQAHTVTPERTEGLKKAEVARGGVDTREVSSRTMESQRVPGLFFCGEVLDVTGRLGGFNLHWAFASGQAAGEAV